MVNRWGIPKEVENHVKAEDKDCVYCGVEFSDSNTSRKFKASWEHIVNDLRINRIDNIAFCCISCNASKGAKLLEDWLQSDYCKKRGITKDTVDAVVKEALVNPPKLK